MATTRVGTAVRQLEMLYSVGAFGALSDEQLLDRFKAESGEASELAFAVLVERHGPMVLRVCRAALGDEHEAQDAFQAAFLVLARRGGLLHVGESLGPWLYEVARRVAASARATAMRRRERERHAAELRPLAQTVTYRDLDLERVLHDEIGRLPQRYRTPVVLCLVEGFTHEQAARHVGWPVGTVKSRLAGARERLRSRLIRRGLAPAVTLAATIENLSSARAAIPASLVEATARVAYRQASGHAASCAITASVAALAAGAQRSGFVIIACLVMAAMVALGAVGLPSGGKGQSPVSGVRLTFVDLQWIANHKRADALGPLGGNNLAALPEGPQKLGGTWFKIGERVIRVRGQKSAEPAGPLPNLPRALRLLQEAADRDPEPIRPVPNLTRAQSRVPVDDKMASVPPEAVRSIKIDGRFDSLHILHSTMFGNGFGVDGGTEIGTYIVHYADRTKERVPINYGEDVRDWWRSSDPALPSRGKLAWSGKNPALSDDDEIRLFTSEWKNPRPDAKVVAIDFESRNTVCAPFLVALTLERLLRERNDDTR
jgi:RNA polymerase sigma factor (sigma-70 family)